MEGTYTCVSDISCSIPKRGKLRIDFNSSSNGGIRAVNSTNDVEFAVKWELIQEMFCLPVPEKAQAQYNFCVFANELVDGTTDQILWTVPASIPKNGVVTGGPRSEPGATYKDTLISTINKGLKPFKRRIVEPTSQEFKSEIVQAHRKGETAYHVKAFRGSKDGFLFFLSSGIVWGFKKPLEYFPFESIDSVSYTSVLQRTFNMNIAVHASNGADVQELEFSMVDQADFAGIDAYVKRHQLQDASMAEQRRAKKLNINGVKGEKVSQEGVEEDEGELEKARREAEDLEDDEEDDDNFDPGSEGESEGEGSSSGEDGGGGGGQIIDLDQDEGSEDDDVEE